MTPIPLPALYSAGTAARFIGIIPGKGLPFVEPQILWMAGALASSSNGTDMETTRREAVTLLRQMESEGGWERLRSHLLTRPLPNVSPSHPVLPPYSAFFAKSYKVISALKVYIEGPKSQHLLRLSAEQAFAWEAAFNRLRAAYGEKEVWPPEALRQWEELQELADRIRERWRDAIHNYSKAVTMMRKPSPDDDAIRQKGRIGLECVRGLIGHLPASEIRPLGIFLHGDSRNLFLDFKIAADAIRPSSAP